MACSSGGDGEDAPPICARREALTVGLTGKAADQLRKIRGLYSQRLRPPGSPADTPDEFHSLLSRSGTLSHLSGKYLSVPVPVPPAATPDQVALSFLKTCPDLHGLDLTSSLFVLKQAVALPTGDVNVVLQQYTNGVKVLGAEVRMMVSPQREVRSYHGRSSPDIALPAKPVVSSAKALQVAAANSPAAVADQVELVYLDPDITTFSNQQHLAWRHQAHDASTSWVSYVDAVTGDLIVKKDSTSQLRRRNLVGCLPGRRSSRAPEPDSGYRRDAGSCLLQRPDLGGLPVPTGSARDQLHPGGFRGGAPLDQHPLAVDQDPGHEHRVRCRACLHLAGVFRGQPLAALQVGPRLGEPASRIRHQARERLDR